MCQAYHCVQSNSNRKWPWSSVLHRAMTSFCFLLVLAWLCCRVCSWFQKADHRKANLRSLFPVCHWTNCNMFRWFRNGISGRSQRKKQNKKKTLAVGVDVWVESVVHGRNGSILLKRHSFHNTLILQEMKQCGFVVFWKWWSKYLLQDILLIPAHDNEAMFYQKVGIITYGLKVILAV